MATAIRTTIKISKVKNIDPVVVWVAVPKITPTISVSFRNTIVYLSPPNRKATTTNRLIMYHKEPIANTNALGKFRALSILYGALSMFNK